MRELLTVELASTPTLKGELSAHLNPVSGEYDERGVEVREELGRSIDRCIAILEMNPELRDEFLEAVRDASDWLDDHDAWVEELRANADTTRATITVLPGSIAGFADSDEPVYDRSDYSADEAQQMWGRMQEHRRERERQQPDDAYRRRMREDVAYFQRLERTAEPVSRAPRSTATVRGRSRTTARRVRPPSASGADPHEPGGDEPHLARQLRSVRRWLADLFGGVL